MIVAFRGSDDIQAWIDFNAALALTAVAARRQGPSRLQVRVRPRVLPLQDYLPRGARRLYTGHSLGGALAGPAVSADASSGGYSFGAPRVGDRDFADATDDRAFYRVVNHTDLVTELPLGLSHVGQLRYIAHDGSILTEPPADVVAPIVCVPTPRSTSATCYGNGASRPHRPSRTTRQSTTWAHLERATSRSHSPGS